MKTSKWFFPALLAVGLFFTVLAPLAASAGDYLINPDISVSSGRMLLAHHVGNRPDGLTDPENVHNGMDDWTTWDPNGFDFPEEPENRPEISPGPDIELRTLGNGIRSGRDNRRGGRENRPD